MTTITLRKLIKPTHLAAAETRLQALQKPAPVLPPPQPPPDRSVAGRLVRPERPQGKFDRALASLAAEFPQFVFRPPFKVGLRNELMALLPPEKHARLVRLMKQVVLTAAYSHRTLKATHRHDMHGQPCEPVSDEHRAHAQHFIDVGLSPKPAPTTKEDQQPAGVPALPDSTK
jgi:hypothetical protein